MHLTRSIDPCLYSIALPVRAQFQTGWVTFVTMKDTFDQRLYRPQVEVAREVLQARDLLIDLEKVALHPALNVEWKVVPDLNVGIVEAFKLKQPVLVALFIAQRPGEATVSDKAGAIRTVHAQLKELKAMGSKGGFVALANWVIPPPGHGSIWGAPPQPAHPPHYASGGFGRGGGGVPVAPVTLAGHTWEVLTVAREGTPAAARGNTAPRTGDSTGDTGGGATAGVAAAEAPRFAGSIPSRVPLPPTILIRCAH